MNRFTRLVEIRRIQEESLAGELAKAQGRVAELRAQLAQLDTDTASGRTQSLDDVDHGDLRLPPALYEEYFQGQSWRHRQLEREIAQALEEVERARQAWQAARVRVKQTQGLEERLDQRHERERQRRELQELDQVGSLRYVGQGGS